MEFTGVSEIKPKTSKKYCAVAGCFRLSPSPPGNSRAPLPGGLLGGGISERLVIHLQERARSAVEQRRVSLGL